MRTFKKQVSVGQYRIGALWGDYEPRFMDLIDSLCLVLQDLTDEEKDDLVLHLQYVVDAYKPDAFPSFRL